MARGYKIICNRLRDFWGVFSRSVLAGCFTRFSIDVWMREVAEVREPVGLRAARTADCVSRLTRKYPRSSATADGPGAPGRPSGYDVSGDVGRPLVAARLPKDSDAAEISSGRGQIFFATSNSVADRTSIEFSSHACTS